VTLKPQGSATVVRLVHSDLPAAARDDHDGGWKQLLEGLVSVATG